MTNLIKYDAARQALQIAHTVDEVRDIKDRAEAVRAYARQAGDVEMQNWAVEIKLRAERRAGELLAEMKEAGILNELGRVARNGMDVHTISEPVKTLALADIGVTKVQSADWQRVAKVPESEFEHALATVKSSQTELTGAAVRRALNTEPTTTPKPPKQLDADDRYRKLRSFVANLYFMLPIQQRHDEIRQHTKMVVEALVSDYVPDTADVVVAPSVVVAVPDDAEYSGPPRIVFHTGSLKRTLGRFEPLRPYSGREYDSIRLFADDGAVKLTAAGCGGALTIQLPDARAYGDVDFLLPLKQLLDVVKTIAATTVAITTSDESTTQDGFSVEVSVPIVVLDSGDIRTRIASCSRERFNNLYLQGHATEPDSQVGVIDLAALKQQIGLVFDTIPDADGKNCVSGAKIESTADHMRMVATDGYHLVISDTLANDSDFAALIPKAALQLIHNMEGSKLTISESEGMYFFATELELLTHSKIHDDGNPLMTGAYKGVFPRTLDDRTRITCESVALLNTVKPLVPFAPDKEKLCIRFEATDTLRLSTADFKANGKVAARIAGPPMQMKLDANLFQPFLKNADGPVTFYVENSTAVVDVHAQDGYRMLIMPMRPDYDDTLFEPRDAISDAFPDDEPGFAAGLQDGETTAAQVDALLADPERLQPAAEQAAGL